VRLQGRAAVITGAGSGMGLAGVMDHMHGVGEPSDDVWRRVLGTNLEGPMFAIRRAVPRMIE
jgi:NAD(P)-dependent dehydrogenase (short-subunit alcohol dehydrogenase family)